jgi:plasmid replication initiation protein
LVYNPSIFIFKLGVYVAQLIPTDKLIVVKHNDLIDAAQRLSIYESRILLTCIARINSKGSLLHTDKFVLTVEDVAALVGIDNNSAYCELKKAVDRLAERWVYFIKPSDRIKEAKSRWVSYVAYIPHEGTIELYFAPHIIPLLSDISKDFTQYKIENVLNFQSMYSLRLYELMCRWGGKEKIVEIEWLKKHLEVGEKHDRIDNFKKWVIENPLQEINKFSNLKVSPEYIKRGRRIVSVKFLYSISQKTGKIIESGSVVKNNHFSNSNAFIKKKTPQSQTASHIKTKYTSEKNDTIDNIEYFADVRKRYGDAAQGIPLDVIELLKVQGRW